MRVLQVNKFYYRRGGDCIVMLRTERLLREHGHEVAVFAMSTPDNDASPWSGYFASEVDFKGGQVKAMRRAMGYGDIVTAFRKVLADFKPDVVHLHNIHSYISPVVARLAHEQGCRVVWTVHDYKLVCPAYTRMRGGATCRACFERKWNVIINKCMRGSYLASAGAWFEAKKWTRERLQEWVDTFICPSHYMAQTMREAGFSENKVKVLYNCVDDITPEIVNKRDDYYCYVGRLVPEKGVAHLLQEASQMPLKLKVAGKGPMEKELREKYAQCDNIEFLGHISAPEVVQLLSHARFSVVPSEWPENNPLGALESLCLGTPVAATNMGGIPELIDYTNGFVARPQALRAAIEQTNMQKWDYESIAHEAQERFAPEIYYAGLMKIYQPS